MAEQPDERLRDALRAAQLYYLQDLTMEAIAHEMHTSRSSVSRLLSYARASGLVTIQIAQPHERATRIQQEIHDRYGIAAHIVIPDNAPTRKVEATRAYGATVDLVPVAERVTRAEQVARETGMTMIPPFDDRDVIAGQGTIGLEIAEDAANLDVPVAAVLVPVSGGGLISGIAAALAALAPEVAVIGVEPELAGDAAESFRAGRRIAWRAEDTGRTCADGLRVPCVGELPWAHIRSYVRDIITVTEDEILAATRALALDARIVAEPSGAASVAAHLFHGAELPAGARVAVVSGGNVDPALLGRLLGGS